MKTLMTRGTSMPALTTLYRENLRRLIHGINCFRRFNQPCNTNKSIGDYEMQTSKRKIDFGMELIIIAAFLFVLCTGLVNANDKGSNNLVSSSEIIISENGEDTSPVTRIRWHDAFEKPAFLGTKDTSPENLGLRRDALPENIAQRFLEVYAEPLQLNAAPVTWKMLRIEHDDLEQTHVHLRQMINGVPVPAADISVKLDRNNTVIGAFGSYLNSFDMIPTPQMTAQQAFSAYLTYLSKLALRNFDRNTLRLVSDHLVIYNPDLMGDSASGSSSLAYELVVKSDEPPISLTAYVDGNTARVLSDETHIHDVLDREIRDRQNNPTIARPGPICLDEANLTNPLASADCTDAFNFTQETYDYFDIFHERDSYDDDGATMIAVVRHPDLAGNARWRGKRNRTEFGVDMVTRDIVAHEWTHAVTDSTANLRYRKESGALDEAFSDIFAAMVDNDDWTIGEGSALGIIRNMSNPPTEDQPNRVTHADMICGGPGRPGDYFGVHTNSGIINHAAFLMADGDTFNGYTINGMGRQNMADIFYRALTVYLRKGSRFYDAYEALIASATDRFGLESPEYITTVESLQATEMSIPLDCPWAKRAPALFVDNVVIDDDVQGPSNGDGDGIIECGETITLEVALRNRGDRRARQVNATVAIDDPFITVQGANNSSQYPNIDEGNTAVNQNTFAFTVAPNTPPGHEAKVIVNMVGKKNILGKKRDWVDTFTLQTSNVCPLPAIPPVAVCSPPSTSGEGPLLVNFSSAGSSDSNGSIVSYLWEDRSGGTIQFLSNDPNPQVTFAESIGQMAIHDIQLTVTDNDGLTDTASCQVLVECTEDPDPNAPGCAF